MCALQAPLAHDITAATPPRAARTRRTRRSPPSGQRRVSQTGRRSVSSSTHQEQTPDRNRRSRRSSGATQASHTSPTPLAALIQAPQDQAAPPSFSHQLQVAHSRLVALQASHQPPSPVRNSHSLSLCNCCAYFNHSPPPPPPSSSSSPFPCPPIQS